MTANEFEKELVARLEDIRALYKRYYPETFNKGEVYLTMSIDESVIMANNRYWSDDMDMPVNVYKNLEE